MNSNEMELITQLSGWTTSNWLDLLLTALSMIFIAKLLRCAPSLLQWTIFIDCQRKILQINRWVQTTKSVICPSWRKEYGEFNSYTFGWREMGSVKSLEKNFIEDQANLVGTIYPSTWKIYSNEGSKFNQLRHLGIYLLDEKVHYDFKI